VLVSLCAAIRDFVSLYASHAANFALNYNASEDIVTCGIMAVRFRSFFVPMWAACP
jgi:glucokinase